MKTNLYFSVLFLFLIISCSNDDADEDLALVAFPETISVSDFRNAISISSPRNIENTGKIYAYSRYVFVVDTYNGIHVIDNSIQESPTKTNFIEIPGVVDVSVKEDFLYADSAVDLVVFDISNINNIELVERLENVFSIYDYRVPSEAEFTDFTSIDFQNDIIVGWELKMKNREDYQNNDIFFLDNASSESGGKEINQGGSLARFRIVDNHLYTVDQYEMNIFNITNLENPQLENVQYAGWNIETIFYADRHLFLGGTNGMYIYSMENPSAPTYVSEFVHWEGCDPVVVDGDFAYLTLRGGNACGQMESVLEVIDISDKSNPFLIDTYSLENPYGLGYKGDNLFICDGNSGLKLFDKTDPTELIFLKSFSGIQAKDVIPLNNALLLIGDNVLYQYSYQGNDLELLSSFNLN